MTHAHINNAFVSRYPEVKSRLRRAFGNSPELGEDRVQESICMAYENFVGKAKRTGTFLNAVQVAVPAILNVSADRKFVHDYTHRYRDVFSHAAYRDGKVERLSLDGLLNGIIPIDWSPSVLAGHISEALSVKTNELADFRLDIEKFVVTLSTDDTEILRHATEGYNVKEISVLMGRKYAGIYKRFRQVGRKFCEFFDVSGYA